MVLFNKYYSDCQMEGNEWAGIWRIWETEEVHTGFWWRNLNYGGDLENLDLDGRIILKWVFRKQYGGLDCIDLAQDRHI